MSAAQGLLARSSAPLASPPFAPPNCFFRAGGGRFRSTGLRAAANAGDNPLLLYGWGKHCFARVRETGRSLPPFAIALG